MTDLQATGPEDTQSDSLVSEDFLSPSPNDDDDDTELDLDLEAMETPSDTESLAFPFYDQDMLDDLRRLGVASSHLRAGGPGSGGPEFVDLGLGCREDQVDSQGTRSVMVTVSWCRVTVSWCRVTCPGAG
ncbi:hypothetical protein CRUP_009351 [Coryphaenoides rupestris]|nr:hypothetical protein CRUP_009351 [Coryphaenoides rupestris]